MVTSSETDPDAPSGFGGPGVDDFLPADSTAERVFNARERLIGEFEDLWRSDPATTVETFLRRDGVGTDPAEGEGGPLLVELVFVELELRTGAGESVEASEYLRRFPSLAADDGSVRALLDAARGSRKAPPGAGGRLGKYELLELVGKGAFGVVYRARDVELDRVVALKLPKPGRVDGPDAVSRSLREARNVAALRHPGIVALLDAGFVEGTFVLVSEFVDGRTLAHVIEHDRPDPRRAVGMMAAIAEAVGEAHRLGVTHRDLKPANILVDRAGSPRVTDFGLARRAGDATVTADGLPFGTPAYMSPEQARGDVKAVGAGSDVFSLGSVFYHLLTGILPFRADVPRLLQQVIADDPTPPRSFDDRVPRDVETVCLKCLEKDPRRRYADASALALDLRRYLAGEPVLARPTPPWERAWKRARRRPSAAAAWAAGLVALLVLVGSWLLNADRERRHAVTIARNERRHTGEIRLEAETTRRNLYDVEISLAYDAFAKSRFEAARQLLVAQAPGPGQDDLRGFEWRYLARLCDRDRVLRGHEGTVHDIAFSTDGSWLATASADHTAKLWDTRTWSDRSTLRGHERVVDAVQFTPDGTAALTASYDGTIRRWDVRTGTEAARFRPGRGAVLALAVSPDGTTLAASFPVGGSDILLLDSATGTPLGRLLGHTKVTWSHVFSPDGTTLATAGSDGRIGLWDMASRKLRAFVDQGRGEIYGLAFAPDGRTVASTGDDRLVRFWDVADGTPRGQPAGPAPGPIETLAYSPDGTTLAIGYRGGCLLWDLRSGRPRGDLKGHTGVVRRLAFSPDGRVLVSGGDDAIIRLWDPARAVALARPSPGLELPSLAAPGGRSAGNDGLALSGDGAWIALALGDGVEIYDGRDGRKRGFIRCDARVWAVEFLSDSRTLAVAVQMKAPRLWDVTTGEESRRPRLAFDGPGFWWSLTLSPDGTTLIAGDGLQGSPGAVIVWDLATGSRVAEWRGHAEMVRAVAVSPDGRTLASASGDETVKLWDFPTGRAVATLTGHRAQVLAVAFAPDGATLASASEDHTIRIWDVRARREIATLKAHASPVHALAYTPDGRRLASAARDGSILLWDVVTLRPLAPLVGHPGRVNALEFTPDGSVLVSCGYDGSLRLWDGRPAGR